MTAHDDDDDGDGDWRDTHHLHPLIITPTDNALSTIDSHSPPHSRHPSSHCNHFSLSHSPLHPLTSITVYGIDQERIPGQRDGHQGHGRHRFGAVLHADSLLDLLPYRAHPLQLRPPPSPTHLLHQPLLRRKVSRCSASEFSFFISWKRQTKKEEILSRQRGAELSSALIVNSWSLFPNQRVRDGRIRDHLTNKMKHPKIWKKLKYSFSQNNLILWIFGVGCYCFFANLASTWSRPPW